MVKCSECGLLAFTDSQTKQIQEATPEGRTQGRTWIKVPPNDYHDREAAPVCIIKMRRFKYTSGPNLVAEIGEEYPCNELVDYVPGMGPIDTWRNEMMNRSEANSRNHNFWLCVIAATSGIVGSIVGALISAFAQWMMTKPS